MVEHIHVCGIIDDDVALLLASVYPAHHDNTIVLVHSSRSGDKEGLRGEEAVGELLLDCLSRVNVHLIAWI